MFTAPRGRTHARDLPAGLPTLLLALVLLATALVACSADEPSPRSSAPASPTTSSPTPEAEHPEVRTTTRIGQLVGRLPAPRRKAARTQVAAVVEEWWDAAYLGGTYPRAAFPHSFPHFTRGAELRARKDKRLLSNIDIGDRVVAVLARRKRVVVDVLAVGRRARSATARFELRFRTEGHKAGLVTVRGRLFLVKERSGWRVFGYDVAKGVRA